MATCKDCVHAEVCKAIVTIINEATELQIDDDIETTIDADLTCEYFADRSRFVKLPCLQCNARTERVPYEEFGKSSYSADAHIKAVNAWNRRADNAN